MPDTATATATRRFGRVRTRSGAVPHFWRLGAYEAPPTGAFVALVPGAEAPLLRTSLPDTLKGTAREGVALRQLRDRLGAEAEGLVLRPARFGRHDDGWSSVLAAGRELVARWQAQIKTARGRCRAILPDYLALPAASGLWTVLTTQEPDGVMVQARLGVQDGFSAEAPLAAHLLTQALERARALGSLPSAVLRLGPADATLDTVLDGLPLFTTPAALPKSVPQPRVLAHGEMALDLAHDPRAAIEAAQARLLGLRWPLALVALGLAGWAMATELQTRHEHARAEAINAATIEAVRRDFLPSGPLLDIPAQVNRVLEQRRAPGNGAANRPALLDLLHTSAGRLATRPQAVLTLIVQPGSGITLELELPDFNTLETVLNEFRADGLSVRTLRSGTEPDGRVAATVLIESEGGE